MSGQPFQDVIGDPLNRFLLSSCSPLLCVWLSSSQFLDAPVSVGLAGRSGGGHEGPRGTLPSATRHALPRNPAQRLPLVSPWPLATRQPEKRKNLTEHVETPMICVVLLRTKGKLYRNRTKFKIVVKPELYADTWSTTVFPFRFYGLICNFNI